MKVCPRCGLERSNPTSLVAATSERAQQKEPDIKGVPAGLSEFKTSRDAVFLSPPDLRRRFPLFTNAQLTLIGIGISLLVLMGVIAYLLWRQQQADQALVVGGQVIQAPKAPLVLPSPEPSPSPTPIDDQALLESVKTTLMAYNPLGFPNYKLDVKDAVVTLSGTAEHQPEKDGAENVIILVAGVKGVNNNLKVRQDNQSQPVRVNPVEARILDEALARQAQADERAKSGRMKQPDSVRKPAVETDTRSRDEALALRREAEDKLRSDAEEFQRRQEEIRRLDAERRARAEQGRLEASVLRTGTVSWSGMVDGIDEIVLSGGSASVRHISGNPPREVRASFSAPIPRSPVNVRLVSSNGRGKIDIIQQPSASNGYTVIIRVDDSAKGGDRRYDFSLRWSLQ